MFHQLSVVDLREFDNNHANSSFRSIELFCASTVGLLTICRLILIWTTYIIINSQEGNVFCGSFPDFDCLLPDSC